MTGNPNPELACCWCFGYPNGLAPWGGTGMNNAKSVYDTWYPRQVQSFKGYDWNTGQPLARNYRAQLTPYLTNEKVLRCPGDTPNRLMYQRRVLLTSYVVNSVLCCFNVGHSATVNGCTVGMSYKLGLFKPSGILMWENDETMVIRSGQWDDVENWPDEGISGRHGKGATVGRFDGSAERINRSDFWMMAWNHPYPNAGGETRATFTMDNPCRMTFGVVRAQSTVVMTKKQSSVFHMVLP